MSARRPSNAPASRRGLAGGLLAAGLLLAATAGLAQTPSVPGFVPRGELGTLTTPPPDVLPPTRTVKTDPKGDPAGHVAAVCDLLRDEARRNGLPEAWFARLIWKESRFDPLAVSPVGAEGIAQFMPGTAKLRGLTDSFDMAAAIRASAAYLAEMRATYGNLGLAAIGYNAGEGRLRSWMASGGGFLPLETEGYVADILDEPAANFLDPAYRPAVKPLAAKLDFDEACRKLPVLRTRTAGVVAMARTPSLPWGVQVAGHVNRGVAMGQWNRLRKQFPALLSGYQPVVSQVRNPRARARLNVVRIGAADRGKADAICSKLRSGGGACIVMRNR